MPSIFKKTANTRLFFFISVDILSIVFSVWLSFLVRFDASIPADYQPFLLRIIMLAIICIIPVFHFYKLYSFSWSYVSINEVISLFSATTISFIFLTMVISFPKYFPLFLGFPRSTLVTSYILIFVFCASSRFYKKFQLRMAGGAKVVKRDKTLIAGAGDAGEQILRNMLSSSSNPYLPVGFVDDSLIKQGVKIHGIKVLGKLADIPYLVNEYGVKQLIVAIPSANHKTIRETVQLGRKAGLWKIKIAPQLNEVIRGEVSLKSLKDVDVEDLLGRESIQLDRGELKSFIKDKIVLVTGAAGSIGSELSLQCAKLEPSILLLLDQDETGIFNISKSLMAKFPGLKIQSLIADVVDQPRMHEVFGEFKPNIVFHAAAYKHVPLMEVNISEAVKNNILGTESLAMACLKHNVEKFIFISTDKAINPTSVMGATKRIGEMICQALSQQNRTSFISVRFGNVLNSRGSVIPIFKEQISKGGPVEVTHPDMKRYFMLISEACLLVMQSGAMGNGGEVFVLDMGKPIKILDLAREMIRLSGFEPDTDIAIVHTGMRPGEKLFEEMMTAEEGTVATQNNSIFTAKLSRIESKEFNQSLEILKKAVSVRDMDAVKKVFTKLIPYYKV